MSGGQHEQVVVVVVVVVIDDSVSPRIGQLAAGGREPAARGGALAGAANGEARVEVEEKSRGAETAADADSVLLFFATPGGSSSSGVSSPPPTAGPRLRLGVKEAAEVAEAAGVRGQGIDGVEAVRSAGVSGVISEFDDR